ncbi:MAG TPA: hypothetical protein VII74_00450 [Chthoniobacterales bacterium]
MKLTLLAAALILAGCANNPAPAPVVRSDKRVYTHDELQSTGRSTTAGALKTLSPDISTTGQPQP